MDTVGKLNKRIRFVYVLYGRDDDYGGTITATAQSAEIWASVEFRTVGSDEQQEAAQKSARTSVLVTTRYRTAIKADMKVLYSGRLFEIISVLEADANLMYAQYECMEMADTRPLEWVQQDGYTWKDQDGLTWATQP